MTVRAVSIYVVVLLIIIPHHVIYSKASGAMSWAFIQALTRDPHQQYAQLLKNMRTLLRGKYTQIPQISTAHKMDLFVDFNL